MPIRRGFFGGAINLLPSVTIGATTNFTESRGVFNATINGNLANTTVSFQYSTASNFSSFTSVSGSGSGTGSFSSSATVTGVSGNFDLRSTSNYRAEESYGFIDTSHRILPSQTRSAGFELQPKHSLESRPAWVVSPVASNPTFWENLVIPNAFLSPLKSAKI
jgi:hypothetical protein